MVVCANCGEEDFYQQDGFFFCSLCQTQSQQVREEGLEQCFVDPDALPASQRDRTTQSQSRRRQKDRGRIWMLEEGFTLILKKQVECLIKHGAQPELKDKVFKLWMHYLRTNKVAFCKDAKWLENKHERNFRTDRKRRKIERSRYKKAIRDEGPNDTREEFYAGDDPEEESSEDEFCLDLNDYGKGNISAPEWMTVRKTMIFLYLGLIYSDHNVTFVDLLRWADVVYPLKNSSECFNSDMKFIDKGNATSLVFRLKSAPLPYHSLQAQCGLIASHLGLDDIPTPDMKQLVTTYVVRLALPGELHASVGYLMKEVPPAFKPGCRPPNYDAFAMAYIIIALKLLLGFDDFRERQLSSYARELTQKLPLRQNLFIWDDWVNMQEKRRKRFKENLCPRNLRDADEIRNIEQFVATHKDKMSKVEWEYKPNVCQRKSAQKEIARPLESLASKMQNPTDGATNNEPHSEALFSETLMDDFGLTPTPRDQQTAVNAVKPVLTKEELAFSSKTLRYISEGVDFLEHLGNHGVTDATLSSFYDMETGDDSASAETNQVIAAIRQAILLGLGSDRQVVDPDDPLTELSHRLSLKKDCYMIYNFRNNDWHSSYQWLLQMCGEMIYTPPCIIQNQVRVLELILFKVSCKNSKTQSVFLAKVGHVDTGKLMELEALTAEEDEEIPLEEADWI